MLQCVHNKMTNEYMIGEMATWIKINENNEIVLSSQMLRKNNNRR